ncbi:retrotransposon protein, putative, ty1-copia subclass [Tanacetum coccineum]
MEKIIPRQHLGRDMDTLSLRYAFWVNQCTSGFHGLDEPGGSRGSFEVGVRVAEKEKLFAKFFKYEFWLQEVHFLGHVIKNPQGAKGSGKGKGKKAYPSKPKIPPPPKKENLTKDPIFHHCKELGHWRRNYLAYLVELKKKKKTSLASTLGIFIIELYFLLKSSSSIYNVSNKRAKHALDSTYLWHCRLRHINKKRIEKLQHDEILQPTDDESFDKCKSCISRKMARKPFPHQTKRAKDLLGLIHTDVCGTFRTMSREGDSYFITFTGYFSRYGYVYLMKHKHEVFETFKTSLNVSSILDKSSMISLANGRAFAEALRSCACAMVPRKIKALSKVDFIVHWRIPLRTVESKWLFKKKTDMDCNVHTFKACLMAKGYTQTYGVDYGKTFSPVVEIKAIRILLAKSI